MKKLIYLILFIPVIGFGQTYPHQIEPDTTHRMIMMTDTSVIDSPAMEFMYFSIDSLVEQIASDTLGLDSSYWYLDPSGLSLTPKYSTTNLSLMGGAGASVTSGTDNVYIGANAGNANTTGLYNVFLGSGAGQNNTGGNNMFIGQSAFKNSSSSSFNVGIGSQVAINNTGSNSLMMGYQAGANSTGARNIFLGYTTGRDNTGTNNTYLGYQAGRASSSGSSNVFLGYQAGFNETGSNKLYIENSLGSSPLIYGDFSSDEVTINNDLYVNSLETSDYLYSTSDQILGGNWVDGDWTLTGNVDTLFFGDPSNIDTVIVSAGDPDQTLSFSDPDLTISGSGGNTIDISGVNYWDTNADGIYTLDNVGINTTPHATHPFYVVGTMWLDGPVRDGNGNFSGGTGNIMTANSSGEFLWEAPGNIGLSSFNNDAGFLTSEVDGSTSNELQTLSLSGSTLSLTSGGAVTIAMYDSGAGYVRPASSSNGVWFPDGILDFDLDYGTSGQVLSSTGTNDVNWIDIPLSPWTDNGLYVSTTNNEDVYIAAGESIGLATTIPSSSYQIDGDTDSAVRLRGDLYDKNSDNGASGDVLMSDGDQIVWVTKGSAQLEDALESTSSTTYVDINFTSGGSWGITGSTTTDDFSIPYTGVYKMIASGGNSSTGQCIVQFERNGTGIYELNIGTGHDQNNSGTYTPAAFSFHYIASFTAGDDITMAFKAGTNTCVLDDIVFSIETMSVVGGI